MCKVLNTLRTVLWANTTLEQFTKCPNMLPFACTNMLHVDHAFGITPSPICFPLTQDWLRIQAVEHRYLSHSISCRVTFYGFFAGWVPPSLTSLSPSAESAHTAPPTAAAAMQPDASQCGQGRSSASPVPCDKLGDAQALVGLQSYASETESSSSGSGDFASSAKNESLGPFF